MDTLSKGTILEAVTGFQSQKLICKALARTKCKSNWDLKGKSHKITPILAWLLTGRIRKPQLTNHNLKGLKRHSSREARAQKLSRLYQASPTQDTRPPILAAHRAGSLTSTSLDRASRGIHLWANKTFTLWWTRREGWGPNQITCT